MNTWQKLRTMTKSSKDTEIGGVCGALGSATPIPSWMWRVGFLLAFTYYGVGLLPYIVLCICIPEEKPQSEPA
jgi:phage shock protein PspC (stress-responsive transcriptional regulator)